MKGKPAHNIVYAIIAGFRGKLKLSARNKHSYKLETIVP
jgi:hypothetical protein